MLRALSLATALAATCLISACASAPPSYAARSDPRTVWIVGGAGTAIGQATFTDGPHGVLIRLEFAERSLPPGWHGLHLHEVGNCSDFAGGFQAAGGHLGMDRRIAHGLLHPSGPEAGDLPNLFAAPAAPYAAEFLAPYTVLGSERIPGTANRRERLPLIDSDGTALMIHAGHDDQTSQPIGGAGNRIACAALTRRP
jgi:Cu-Zn family superoxide dismutase